MAHERRWNLYLPAAIIVVVLSAQLAQGGNTACVSNQLSWYTSVVGESPCMTYQRLRQICNNDYQVPSFSSQVPGDRCDDQVSECCCNMVAFQLSMLCMVCQQDHQDSGGIGIDALAKGTYTVYRGTCGAGVNHTLPSDLQSAICNENIRIDNFLYDSWDDGTWFYVWTKENVERLHAANNNNTFTHCPNQISPSPTPTPVPSTTPQAPVPTSKVSSAAAAPNTPNTQAATPNTSNIQAAPPTSGGVPLPSSAPVSVSSPASKTNAAPEIGSSSVQGSVPSSSSASAAQSSDADLGGGGGRSNKSLSHASLIGAIVGGVLGAVLLLAALIIWRRKTLAGGRLRGTHDDTDSVRPRPLIPNRLLGTAERRAPPGTGTHDEDDPFMSEISPRTPGTGSSTIGPTVPLSSTPLTETSLRHHDAGPLMTGRARSNSGRLPPAYDDSWDSDRGRSTHPGTASVSLSAPTSRSDDPVSEVSVGHTMSHSVTSGSTDFHESALIGLAAARSLPIPPTTAATPSDLKGPSPFD